MVPKQQEGGIRGPSLLRGSHLVPRLGKWGFGGKWIGGDGVEVMEWR